jgi:dihydrofolate reductase
MRKVILFVNASLDGFLGGPEGEMGWMVDDEEMDHDFTTDIRGRADTIVAGRALYQSFESAWPAMARNRASLSPEMAAFAEWMVTTPIVVFSRSQPELGTMNARLATRSIADEVAALRDRPGGDIVTFGGARTVAELVGLGLVDEYWLKVEPVAIGRGLPVFAELDAPLDLALVWSKVYASGVVGLRYETVKRPESVVRSRYVRDRTEEEA